MDQADNLAEMGEQPELKSETLDQDITAQEINLIRGEAHTVRGINVTLRQAGAHTINAENLILRQGGAVKVEAGHLEMTQGGLVAAKTQKADLKASYSTLVIAEGPIHMDQSGAQVLVAKGDVTMDQSGAVVLISRTVKAEHSGATFLIAREVQGDIKATFGPKESLIFGAAAGIVAGLTCFLFRMLSKSR
ncbi:MAG: hypothetical protein HY892_03545 [Deltaproteobacteria bacterium]|nr:hypothetical protein [Deltaproteobacteria bacterium]